MPVRVEFYGIPRRRAGVDAVDVDVADLGAALRVLSEQLPAFARECLDDGGLCGGVIASVNGRTFTRDPSTPLRDGDSLLILSNDSGG